MRRIFLGHVTAPILASAATLVLITPTQALTAQECKLKFLADTNAGRNEKRWDDFRKIECGPEAAITPAPATSKPAEKMPIANKAANTDGALSKGEQKATQSYGNIHYANDDFPIISLADFTAEFRQALGRKVGDLKPYSEDLRRLFALATKCPALVPARECELLPLHFESGLAVLDPFVIGSEPRKLYVQAGSTGAFLPNTKKLAYMIRVTAETDAHLHATAAQPCKENCAQKIYAAVVIPDAEIAAIRQRNEEGQRRKEEDQRKQDAETQAAREAERLGQLVLLPGAQKLVCQSVDDFVIKYGKTIRLRINTTEKVVGDSADEVFTYKESDTSFRWGGRGLDFDLDRTTLRLQAGGLFGVATYQCQKDQPQL